MVTPPASISNELSPAWALPFIVQVLAVALLPLAAPLWWERNSRKCLVSALLGGPVLLAFPFLNPTGLELILHTAHDYLVFMLLLLALYVASGGIYIKIRASATPSINTLLLIIGALMASVMGTTGAAMVFIRPLLRVNQTRRHRAHTIMFFIFLVGNIGGCLTPIGDPPILLGFIYGVPFTWTLTLWPVWLLGVASLALLYLLIDLYLIKCENIQSPSDRAWTTGLAVQGKINFLWIASILAAVALIPNSPYLELTLVALILFSLLSSTVEIHRANEYRWAPIVEVAVVFAGIFATMIPTLQLLKQFGPQLGLQSPVQFFWATGLLSGLLDNAPTYAVFFNIAKTSALPDQVAGVPASLLGAVSLGAVFFGSLTYISNAPNLMIKAVAEHSGICMFSFLAFLGFSLLILMPLFLAISVLAF